MKRPLNILHVYDYMKLGGAETHIITLASELSRRGENLYIAASDGPAVEMLRQYNIPFFNLNLNDTELQLESILELIKLIRNKKIDIIHAHPFNSQIVSAIAGAVTNTPVITTIHGLYSTPSSNKFFTSLFSKYIYISEEVLDYQVNNNLIPDKSKNLIKVINNSVPLINSDIDESFFRDGKLNLIYISRLDRDKYKSIIFTIESAIKIREYLNLKLTILGNGSETLDIQKKINDVQTSLDEKFIFLEPGSTDVYQYIQNSDIVVGVGRVILEALSMGKYAICIGNENYGGIVSVNNLEQLSKVNFTDRNSTKELKTENLLSDLLKIKRSYPQERQQLLETFNRFKALFTIENSAINHLKCYLEAIGTYNVKELIINEDIESNEYLSNSLMEILIPYKEDYLSLFTYILEDTKPYTILLCPEFNIENDNWRNTLVKLLMNISENDPFTIIIRVQNHYRFMSSEIIQNIEEVIKAVNSNADLMVDIDFHDPYREANFLSRMNYFIPTNEENPLLLLKCKLSNVKITNDIPNLKDLTNKLFS